MKSLKLCLILVTFLACKASGQSKLAWWDFSKQDSLVAVDKISNHGFLIKSNFTKPEYVKGIEGHGLRTDGYSTYVKGDLKKSPSNSFSMSGWFALESFPNDTAGFFAIGDKNGSNWISATVDNFGRLIVGISENGKVRYVPTKGKFKKFAWINLVLTVEDAKVSLWLDKQNVGSTKAAFNKPDFTSIYIGRDHREKFLHGKFPLTSINGLMDEVIIWEGILDQKKILNLYNQYDAKKKPDLAIPSVRFEGDFNRPEYHLLPAANWTNETHGLLLYKGRYHIFNQKNANNLFLGQINWGHFSSPDLIHWTEHKPAITPEHDYEKIGIWSGHAFVNDKGVPTLAYTGSNGKYHGISLAYPKDEKLIEWEKYPKNPVIEDSPAQFSRKDMRDPYVWKDNGNWYMIIGYGVVEEGVEKGSVLLYRSKDSQNWEFVDNLFVGNPVVDNSGVFWEMPVFWKLNGKYILLVNKVPYKGVPAVALYWVGDFKNERFIPDSPVPQKLEVVNRLLSPSVTLDEKGRTVAIAIIPDETSAEAALKQGWTHLYSIPRTWDLKNNRIVQKPLPELEKLREKHTSIDPAIIQDEQPLLLSKDSHQTEIFLKIRPEDCKSFGLNIAKHEDNSEFTKIYYDFESQKMIVDSRKSSENPFIPEYTREGEYRLEKGQEIDLRIFIDGSVAEIFINDADAFTTRMFPAKASSNQVELFSEGGQIELKKADVWTLKSANIKTDW